MNTELVGDIACLWLAFACIFYVVDGWRIRKRDCRIIRKLQGLHAQTWEYDTEIRAEEIATLLGVDLNAIN